MPVDDDAERRADQNRDWANKCALGPRRRLRRHLTPRPPIKAKRVSRSPAASSALRLRRWPHCVVNEKKGTRPARSDPARIRWRGEMRAIAILGAIGILLGLQYGLRAQWYVALPLALIGYLCLRYGREVHRNESWKLGYQRGKAGRPSGKGPWWTDGQFYATGHSHGQMASR